MIDGRDSRGHEPIGAARVVMRVFRPFDAGFGGLRTVAELLITGLLGAGAPAVALASPDCTKAGPKLSTECAVKFEYCKHTSIVLVLAVRGRESGLTESASLRRWSSGKTNETWYKTYSQVVKDIVHQVYTKEQTYQKLRVRIAPSMALAVAAITAGCNADPSVTVDTR